MTSRLRRRFRTAPSSSPCTSRFGKNGLSFQGVAKRRARNPEVVLSRFRVRAEARPGMTRREGTMIPGEFFIQDGEIELNAGRKTVTLTIANTGDRPIQVGSHYHFFETNPALKFDRKKARGMRLDIAAGTAVRFEPGQTRDVQLVAVAGKKTIYGFRQDVMGKL